MRGWYRRFVLYMARSFTTVKSLGMPLHSQPVVEIIVCRSFLFTNLLLIYFLGSLYKMAVRLIPQSRKLVSILAFLVRLRSLNSLLLQPALTSTILVSNPYFLFYWHIVESLFFSVPVFDARGKKPFNLPTDIQGISDILPTFHGEPPEESIVQVGYTVNSYKGSKNPEDLNISLNLLFVIILATDGKTIPLVPCFYVILSI